MTIGPRARIDVDVVVVGSGFAGALAALALRRRDRRVLLVERGRHPRFAIGESTTPLTNLLLEELADRYDLPQVRALSKWATWQRTHPHLACGLKRGFTFMFHRPHERFIDGAEHQRQLLVAASPHDDVADTHWYRADFDHALVQMAQEAGAIYLDETSVDAMRDTGGRVRLEASRHGQSVDVQADFVIDASGPRGFLTRLLGTGLPSCRWLPPTQGLYSHFEGVGLWEQVASPDAVPPYPPDAAALHHVFPGGWIWILRFNNGVTSAGAALTDERAREIGAADGEPAWDRLLDTLPSVAAQFGDARPTLPFIHAPRVAFRSTQVVGPRWALLPSAAGVIDPLLSTGFPLTLLGLGRLLDILETTVGSARQTALAEYERTTQAELDVTEQLVAAMYASMSEPEQFRRLSLLYFAAASYSETARRLGRPHLAPGYLLHAHPTFGPELRACAAAATLAMGDASGRQALFDRIDRAIEPFDALGLLDRSRRNWYPAQASDLLASAAKLEATVDEIAQLLERCGFSGAGTSSGGTPSKKSTMPVSSEYSAPTTSSSSR